MAAYLELRGLFNDGDLVNRTTVAVLVKLDDILTGTPTSADRAYAAQVYANPQVEGKKVLMSVLAANSGATISAITGATDAALQAKVDLVVPHLIDALAGV